MAYLHIVNEYTLTEGLCQYVTMKAIQVQSLSDLEQYNTHYFDAYIRHSPIAEEVSIEHGNVVALSDDTIVPLHDVQFIVSEHCNNIGHINHICRKCWTHKDDYDYVLDVLKHPSIDHGLSVAKKIQYVLKTQNRPMTWKEIYIVGKPWPASGKTIECTVRARCSTLYLSGVLQRKDGYYSLMN